MAQERILAVSFDIKWGESKEETAAYYRIYEALNSAIRDDLIEEDYWNDTTSFYVVRSSETAGTFLARVWNASKMRSSMDRLVVLDVTKAAGAAFGQFETQTLFDLLPSVVKLAAKK